jgi:hypothetical protein
VDVKRVLSFATIIALTVHWASSANAIEPSQSLQDWKQASYGERVALADLFSRVAKRLNANISRDEIASCIDQVAASSSLASQQINDVAKACMLMITTR